MKLQDGNLQVNKKNSFTHPPSCIFPSGYITITFSRLQYLWVCQISWIMCYRGSPGFSAIVQSCLRGYFVGPIFFLLGISWVQNFSRGYFVGLKVFLVGISWVWNFFSRVFRGSKIFLVGPKFFLVSIFVGPKFSRGYFVGPKFFSSEYFVGPIFFLVVDFVIQRFSVAGCISKSDKNKNTKIHLKPRFLF